MKVDEPKHGVHLKLVLELLRKEKLYHKFTKSEAVKNWEVPTTTFEIYDYLSEYEYEIRYPPPPPPPPNPVRQYWWTDALSRKERVKPRRVRAMAMTIQYGVRGMILQPKVKAFQERERTCQKGYMEVKWMRPMHQGSVDQGKVQSGERSSKELCWKKGKLAPRYVEPFEILERIGSIAYRLRLPEELSSVHDTFHVSNLEKKYLVDANLHVPFDEIEGDKTLRFVKEPKTNMDREI
ncbi:hypothetical protein Tco_0625815 [Tanacetum coccineum]|uniref:Tf2-1-like SH3-like domain-containing protein n=1 Tax=Tanacetum coccineum TaxID=301880 RepID=A0ABQ4WHT8_9ASTR